MTVFSKIFVDVDVLFTKRPLPFFHNVCAWVVVICCSWTVFALVSIF